MMVVINKIANVGTSDTSRHACETATTPLRLDKSFGAVGKDRLKLSTKRGPLACVGLTQQSQKSVVV